MGGTDEQQSAKEELAKSLEEAKKAFKIFSEEPPTKLTQEPEFTTSKWRKGGVQEDKRGIINQTIDYIFYTKEFECTRVLDLPKEDIEDLLMPGWKYPSDHFMICADLTLSNAPVQNDSPRGEGALRAPIIYAPPVRPGDNRATRIPVSKPHWAGNSRRRRMAQREFSSRRDSPVMVRLLQEIID